MSAALRLVSTNGAPLAPANDMAVVWAIDDAGLPQAQHRLLSRIYRRYSPGRGCDESVPNMAAACRMKDDTAREAKKALVAAGYLCETERRGQASRLDVTHPGTWPNPAMRPVPLPNGGRGSRPDPSPETPLPNGGSPPEPGEGYPSRMGGDEVYPVSEPIEPPSPTRAREGVPGGFASHPAVVAFREAFPAAMPDAHALRRLAGWLDKAGPRGPDVLADTLSDWRTRYGGKPPIVSDLLDRLTRNLTQTDAPTPRPPGRDDYRARASEARNEPARAHERIRGDVRAALGLGSGDVEGAGD